MASRVDATGAPMPVTPWLSARAESRLGRVRGTHARVTLRHRSSTTSNVFGTLPVPAYTLFDAAVVWPVSSKLRVVARAENVLDLPTAQDLNGLPLPGRLLFASVEANL